MKLALSRCTIPYASSNNALKYLKFPLSYSRLMIFAPISGYSL